MWGLVALTSSSEGKGPTLEPDPEEGRTMNRVLEQEGWIAVKEVDITLTGFN